MFKNWDQLTRAGRRVTDFAEVEAEVAAAVARVETAAVGAVLKSLDRASERVRFEGKSWVSLGESEKTFYTQAGPTTITRRLYREVGVHNGPTIDPVALRAGVVGDGWLPGTAKAMAHLLQQGTPREAATTAQRVGRLPYSRSSFERTGHRVASLYLERRLEIEDELAELVVVPDDAKSVSVGLVRGSSSCCSAWVAMRSSQTTRIDAQPVVGVRADAGTCETRIYNPRRRRLAMRFWCVC
mgnify:CR=1 FL=1